MKTTTEKTFDAVKFMRAQRENLNKQLTIMSNKEIVDYFKKQNLDNPVKPSA